MEQVEATKIYVAEIVRINTAYENGEITVNQFMHDIDDYALWAHQMTQKYLTNLRLENK